MIAYLMMIDSPEEKSKFEKIYLHYKGFMYYVAFQILNNESDAEDAVHNAFVKIAEVISGIEDAVCPKTQHFVLTIVERKAIDIYRGNKRRNVAEYMDEISPISVEPEKLHGLSACMARLPARYREVLLLKYYHGYSCKEIAKLMSVTESNAIKLDQRAKNKLLELCKAEELL